MQINPHVHSDSSGTERAKAAMTGVCDDDASNFALVQFVDES
jgi:hypothetical protein